MRNYTPHFIYVVGLLLMIFVMLALIHGQLIAINEDTPPPPLTTPTTHSL